MYRRNIKQSQAKHAYENFIVFANTLLPKIRHLTKGMRKDDNLNILIFDPQVKIGIFLFNDFWNKKFGILRVIYSTLLV
jgi:hypothetical protein